MIAELRQNLVEKLGNVPNLLGAIEFGSATTGEENHGDYDFLVVSDSEFVIPRTFYEQIGRIYSEIFEGFRFPLDIIVTDKSMPSTLFSTIGLGIRNHFQRYSKVLVGSDVSKIFTDSFYDHKDDYDKLQYEALHHLAWGLKDRRFEAVKIDYLKNHEKSRFGEVVRTGVKLRNYCSNAAIFEEQARELNEGFEMFKRTYKQRALSFVEGNSFRYLEEMESIQQNAKQTRDDKEKIDLFFRALAFREKLLVLLYGKHREFMGFKSFY